MRARWTRPTRWLTATAAAVLLAGAGVLEVLSEPSTGDVRTPALAWAVLAGAAVLLAPLQPLLALVVAVAAAVLNLSLGLHAAGGAHLVVMLVLLAWTGAAVRPRRSAAALAAVCLVFVGLSLIALGSVWEAVFYTVIYTVGWLVGLLLRRERERAGQLRRLAAELAAQREASARAAVVEERARIARELHDAVAHSVSVMVLQVGAVRHRLDDRTAERDVLLAVEALGRQSVDELRRLVGILRADDAGPEPLAPQPSLARLEELLDPVRAAGLDVTVGVDGTPVALPPGLDLSAYRVLQEALTNVLRHAPGARARVRLRWTPDELVVGVEDDGAPVTSSVASSVSPAVPDRAPVAAAVGHAGADGTLGAAPSRRGGGHGLATMRERATAFGGAVDAGPRAEGGFAVTARFPLPRGRR
ncbi:sensor histidine kinase [Cellulomonas marina]|uniref:histidine kinase n=1 Tax=Cellulomonas marina TaxID=988821 RepID=A0A1I1ART3_9CELL|nr:histidine kinase [Cellulomonas marina]SFB39050.1 Signal transduction histidine kinase [Cellulomonas marina]